MTDLELKAREIIAYENDTTVEELSTILLEKAINEKVNQLRSELKRKAIKTASTSPIEDNVTLTYATEEAVKALEAKNAREEQIEEK